MSLADLGLIGNCQVSALVRFNGALVWSCIVTRLARRTVAVVGQPDAGIWEFRSEWRPQTFSSLMCWAAAVRRSLIAKLHRPADVAEFRAPALRIRGELLSRAMDPVRRCFVADYGGTEVDAALLQAVTLRFNFPQTYSHVGLIHAAFAASPGWSEHGRWLARQR